MPQDDLPGRVREILRFDRYYETRLREASKAVRVNEVNIAELGIFLELLPRPCPPGWLCSRLGLDPGYLSRSLRRLELDDCITVCGDRRNRQASLTARGLVVARSLQQFQEDAARRTLQDLSARNQRRLVRSMQVIIELLEQ